MVYTKSRTNRKCNTNNTLACHHHHHHHHYHLSRLARTARVQRTQYTHTMKCIHKSAKWFSGFVCLSINLRFVWWVFEIIFFFVFSFGFILLHLVCSESSAWEDRHSGDKMRNKAKPLETLRIRSALRGKKIERDSLPKLAKTFCRQIRWDPRLWIFHFEN